MDHWLKKEFAAESSALAWIKSSGFAPESCRLIREGGHWSVSYDPAAKSVTPDAEVTEVVVSPATMALLTTEAPAAVEAEPPQAAQPDLFVIAKSAQEMMAAQNSLIAWFTRKIATEEAEAAEIEASVEEAKKRKWRLSSWRAMLDRQRKRIGFYTKCRSALEHGYCIIPEFPIDILAIRVNPERVTLPADREGWHNQPDKPLVDGHILPEGAGEYVSTVPAGWRSSYVNDKKERRFNFHVTGTQEPEFPFAIANPVLMDAADKALAIKLFDEIGFCPPTNTPVPARQGRGRDPMLIGRVGYRHGYTTHRLSFLIGWWIDPKTL